MKKDANEDFLAASLVDWRFQCEERIHRWKQNRATPEWHLTVPETLQLLDALAAKDDQIEALERERDDAVSHAKQVSKALSGVWVARLAIAAARVCNTPPGNWEVKVNGEAFNSLDAVLCRREKEKG